MKATKEELEKAGMLPEQQRNRFKRQFELLNKLGFGKTPEAAMLKRGAGN